MPYIKHDAKSRLLDNNSEAPATVGELNYCITQLCTTYEKNFQSSYQTYNDIIGALECAKQEFYRRIIVPYEEMKRKENGDVY